MTQESANQAGRATLIALETIPSPPAMLAFCNQVLGPMHTACALPDADAGQVAALVADHQHLDDDLAICVERLYGVVKLAVDANGPEVARTWLTERRSEWGGRTPLVMLCEGNIFPVQAAAHEHLAEAVA